MSEASTKLVLDNSSGTTVATLTMRMNEGQYMELCLRINPDPQRTVHQTELAVLQQAKYLIEHMLQA